MKITDALLTMGAKHGRTGKAIQPQGIVVHCVANPGSSAMANRNYFESGSEGRGVSTHYIVGLEGEVLRCIPETEVAQHAGAAYSNAYLDQAKVNNSIYYGIEACHPTSDGEFSDITYQSLVELVAELCIRHGFDPGKNVFTHNQVTGKICPIFYVNHPAAWNQFKLDVQACISAASLQAGYVNLGIDGVNYEVQAVNQFGRFYTPIEVMFELLGDSGLVSIRDVLEANGYSVTWSETLQRISAVRNNRSTFKNMRCDF